VLESIHVLFQFIHADVFDLRARILSTRKALPFQFGHPLHLRTTRLPIYTDPETHSCRAPDWTTRVLYKCPCGDQPVMIPVDRQAETYLEGAYWCSTVMLMLDFDGSPKYVWNPFSLKQLKSKMDGFDSYLECTASKNDGSCSAPTDPIFEKQQIPLLSVYQRCLTNYQEKLWDQGAYVMFNATLQQQLRLDQVMPSVLKDRFGVSQCLLQQKATGGDNTGCLTDYFLKGVQSVDYFAYSNITTTDTPNSEQIDACLTFSGPAALPDPNIANVFLNCLESNANNSGCEIPHMLWSGRSNNRLPVATQHAMNISDPDKKKALAQGEIAAAQATVLEALEEMKKWQGSGLKITLFSSEGVPFLFIGWLSTPSTDAPFPQLTFFINFRTV
jgi:hypothetical protein